MAAADLSRVASLETMVRIGSLDVGELEGTGSPTTPAEELVGRNGYQPTFLNGWR
jgi:hypothetical protein